MKKIFAHIILVKFLMILLISNSFSVTGKTSVYKVTMQKAELCTGATSVNDCQGAVIIGEGAKEIDIAAVDAGAVAGSYGDATLLPLGVTYTHMRVTIDRKFSIKSEGALDTGESGDTDDCKTIATTDGMYATDEATDKYSHKPVVAEGGTHAEMNLYLVNDDYTMCTATNCSTSSTNQTMTYATNTTYAKFVQQHAKSEDPGAIDTHMIVYELVSPYTVSLIPPIIDIAFGTSKAMSANETNSLCALWAEEPDVTITIK